MNLKDILSSNVYLSITIGILISVLNFILNRNNPEESKFKKHLKLAVSSALLIFIGLYLKGNNKLVGGSNTNSSAPWATDTLEDINLDDPFKL